MKKLYTTLFSIACIVLSVSAQTPVSINGKLKIINDLQLANECGKPVQLRGMSSHGLQWYSSCITKTGALTTLKQDWGADIIRLAMYVEEGGYKNDPNYYKAFIDDMVDVIGDLGLYVMIDWHILSDGDPNKNIEAAKEFWGYMSKKHAGKKHVLYEICNEPNGTAVTWAVISKYAKVIIPIIRANDPSTIIIVGTPEWSGRPYRVLQGGALADYTNIMYAFHFYSGTHSFLLDELKEAVNYLPIFATEWGTGTADGKGTPNESMTNTFMSVFNGGTENKQRVSWINWSYADKNEGSAALLSGSCGSSSWNNVSASGTIVKNLMKTPDAFQSCPTGLNDNELNSSGFTLFPNPAHDKITLNSESSDLRGKTIAILNAYGVKVSEFASQTNKLEIDILNLKSGVYTIRVNSENKEINLKWIKN